MRQGAKKLVFENGAVFYGSGFGADTEALCEVVFNTAMAGYQEIFSDCGYHRLMVCMTYPLIGNYGLAAEDYESRAPRIGGFIVREYNDSLANFRAAKTLGEEMEDCGVPGISGVDTRRITRMLRSQGGMRALLCAAACPGEEALARIAAAPLPAGGPGEVSCKKRWYARAPGARYSVALVDCGVRLGVIDNLTALGCNVTVLPYGAGAEEVLALAPDGLVLSNGPGNPEDAPEAIELIRALGGQAPTFGIGLGHQLLALAGGGKTYKMKCGHRGANHPVRELATGRVEITSQGHGYAVEAASLAGTGLAASHVSLMDGSVEGLECPGLNAFSCQYQPETRFGASAPATGMFGRFIAAMEDARKLRAR